MTVKPLDVLIVGAGVAGSALAAMLGRDGHRVMVVEKDQGVRSSGNPIDVRGDACSVLDALGVLASVRQRATRVDRVEFVDDAGDVVSTLRTQRRPDRDFEVSRADLSAILVDAARPFVEIRFGDTVTSIDPRGRRVEVRFQSAAARSFDLVVGADGLHSTVRRMVFGPEDRFVHPFGMYVVGFPPPGGAAVDESVVVVHNAPGRSATIHPGAGQPVVALIFRSPRRVDPRDRAGVLELVGNAYQQGGWRDRELVDQLALAEDAYIDQVSRVRVRRWSAGRVTLLGDAASCISLFGEGSSSAVIGAGRLARELSRDGDVDGALSRYARRQSGQVRHGQRLAGLASHVLVPATRTGIDARDAVLRLVSTGFVIRRRDRPPIPE